jgi:hypothetical protein
MAHIDLDDGNEKVGWEEEEKECLRALGMGSWRKA